MLDAFTRSMFLDQHCLNISPVIKPLEFLTVFVRSGGGGGDGCRNWVTYCRRRNNGVFVRVSFDNLQGLRDNDVHPRNLGIE